MVARRKTFTVNGVSAPKVFVPDLWNDSFSISFMVTSTSATYSIERTNDDIQRTIATAANWGLLVSAGATTSASNHNTTVPAAGYRLNLLTGASVTFNVIQTGNK